jgi:integrase
MINNEEGEVVDHLALGDIMPKKPRPIADGPLKAYAHRAPLTTDPRWSWRICYHSDGTQRTVRGAGGRYTPAEVRATLRRLLTEGGWRQEAPSPPPLAQTWGTLLDLHLQHLAERVKRGRLAPRSLEIYRHSRRHLSMAGLDVLPITADLDWSRAEQIVHALEDHSAGWSGQTIRMDWSYLRSAVRWAREMRYLPAGTTPRPELPSVEQVYCDRTPTDAEARAVIAQLPDDWRRVGCWILYGTGCRPDELAHARWSDWSSTDSGARWQITTSKTGPRSVVVGPAIAALVSDWRERCGGEGLLLGVLPATVGHLSARGLTAACEQAGVARFTAKGLRNRASSVLIAQGVDPATYAEQMGHSLQVALSHYAEAQPQQRRGAAALLDAPTEDETPPTLVVMTGGRR